YPPARRRLNAAALGICFRLVVEGTLMTSKVLLTMAACALGSAVAFAQSQPPRVPATPYTAKSVQAPIDPGYAEFTKTCKTPPPVRGGGPGRGGPAGPGRAAGAPAPAAGVREYK